MMRRLFQQGKTAEQQQYEKIVAAARQPIFYSDWGVLDTVDGRFDIIVLHLFLVLERLKGQGKVVESFRQLLTDVFFADMDRSLREMGVGDLSVAKKVRALAEAFYGRVVAYETGDALYDGLQRNVYRGKNEEYGLGQLMIYVENLRDYLARQPVDDFIAGQVELLDLRS